MMPRTDVRVRVRRGVVRIAVEQTRIQPVVPIATYKQHLPTSVGVEIIFITKNKNFLTNEGSDWYRSQLARDSPGWNYLFSILWNKNRPRTDVRDRGRRGVARIAAEQTRIQPVVPIATHKQHPPTSAGVEIIGDIG